MAYEEPDFTGFTMREQHIRIQYLQEWSITMKMIADLHCHTLASLHAYSTLRENIESAKKKGLSVLAVTDHGTGCPDSPPLSFFENLVSLPETVDGIRILRGVEANIMDYEGTLDMPASVLKTLDLTVASFHTSCTAPGTRQDHTKAYLNIARNPHVHIIGHSGTAEFVYDYESVIPVFGQYGKIVEINAHTFICRQKSIENCKKIAQLCKDNGVRIAVNSDAHSEFEVGECRRAFQMLEEINFPEELIVNTREQNLRKFLREIGVRYGGEE